MIIVESAIESAAAHPARTGAREKIQRIGSVVVVIICWLWIRPLGFTGVDLIALLLLIANSVFILIRHLPFDTLSQRQEFIFVCSWGLAAAALVSIRSLGIGATFAFFATGHAGYRLRTTKALAMAVAIGILTAIGLWIAQANSIDGWPWLLGVVVALPVFLGMSNRAQDFAVASAIEAARSAKQAADSEARAQSLAERARISRDIHDVLAHSLSGVSMQLELGEMLLDGGDTARAREAMAKAHSMVREGMIEAQRAVSAMRKDILPLDQTLRAQFWGIADLEVTGTARELPTDTGQTLIRGAQEALTNARRHAPSAPIAVCLDYLADRVRLEIDNGPVPFPGSSVASPGSGMGLVGMRERAALLGGRVEVGPILEGPLAGGWAVVIDIPAEPKVEARTERKTS